MSTPNKDEQSGMWDRDIEDPELEAACETLLDEDTLVVVRNHRQAIQVKKDRLKFHGIKPEERLRIGEYVIPGKLYEGGGGDKATAAWSSVSGRPKRLADV